MVKFLVSCITPHNCSIDLTEVFIKWIIVVDTDEMHVKVSVSVFLSASISR